MGRFQPDDRLSRSFAVVAVGCATALAAVLLTSVETGSAQAVGSSAVSVEPTATPGASPSGSVPSAASPLPSLPPTSVPTPSGTAPASILAPAKPAATPVRVPDRVDRAWPAHPPWDACPRPVWPGTPASGEPGDGRRVLFVGDSLTRESRVLTARALRAHGWTPTFRCWGSRRLDWGIAQVARARQLDQLPGVVVIALGTNDISWVDEATTARRVDALLDRLGPRRQVLWVDLHLTRSAWLDARAARFNAMLRDQARHRPNLTIVGWHRVAAAHRIRGWDGIHYGPSGYRLRAKVVSAAVDAVAGSRR
ncbi:MAG: GDSL-type esterase/lipase family protein [Candidatus Nanopelagicales bacterium]